MLQLKKYYFFYCLVLFGIGCTQPAKKKKLVYAVVSDSGYVHDKMYKPQFELWKQAYEGCLKTSLFKNAIYTGLQEKFVVGDITNISEQMANGTIKLFDTSHVKDIYDLFKNNNTSNCYTKLELNTELQNQFYKELKSALTKSIKYQYLIDLIDTSGITFGVTTFADNTLILDSVVHILQRTTDSSLLAFRKILLTPGNVMLTRDVILFGYYSEFSVRDKMPPVDLTGFTKEQFFKTGDYGTGSIQLMPDYRLRVLINKYYTVFGEFYSFKEAEE